MKRLLFMAIAVICLTGVARAEYPFNYFDNTRPATDPVIEESWLTYVMVHTYGTAEALVYDYTKWHKRKGVFQMKGSGYVVKKGYILTAAHVIEPDMVEVPWFSYGVWQTRPYKVLTRTILISTYSNPNIVAEIHFIDTELDIAILKYDGYGILKPGKAELEYCGHTLKKDDLVFSFLHKRGEDGRMDSDVELRYGIVDAMEPVRPDGGNPAWFNPYDITLKMEIQPGDSGSPLFALRDGVPILVGVIRAMYQKGDAKRGYAVSLPKVRRYFYVED